GVPGFFTYRLYKNGILVDSFGPNATANYTFDEMGQGTYTLSVETGKCEVVVTEDVNGNPITIGGGILPIGVTATAENSFGCGATSVDVNLTTFGGTGPYRFSVDGGAFGPTYTGATSFSVTSSG